MDPGFPSMEVFSNGRKTSPQLSPPSFERHSSIVASAESFAEPDFQRFPCLALALEAGQRGGGAPAVLDLVSPSRRFARYLEERGFRFQRSFVRMSLGPGVTERVDRVVAVAGPEFG